MISYIKEDENKNNRSKSKNRKKREKEKGILKNKNGRSRTLLLKSNIEENVKKELNFEGKNGGSFSKEKKENDIDMINTNNNSNIFFNNNDFNKEEIKKLIENKIIRNEQKIKNIKENEEKYEKNKKKKKNQKFEDNLEYEIDYSKQIIQFDKKNKKKKKLAKGLNRSFDNIIYF
jgi:hypothetical protein